jgi:CcmD family protein
MRRSLVGILLWLALVLAASSAAAQDERDAGPQSVAQSRSAQFRAVRGASREHVPGGPLLVAAYGVAWVLVLGYVIRLGVMHARTARDLDRLEKSIAKKTEPGA